MMGAVKNLFVRIGGDASGAVKSFNSASRAGSNAKESIKRSSAETKKAINSGFASVRSIKEHISAVNQTKIAHQTAAQNVGRLTEKIAQLENVYGTIQSATDGLDLSKSLESQIADTEKQLESINAKIVKTQASISRIGNPTSASKAERLAGLQDELQSLIADSDNTAAHLRALDAAASRVGSANMGHASAAGLKSLQTEIETTKAQLRTTQAVVDETGQKLKSLRLGPTLVRTIKSVGTSALQAARAGITKLGSGLKSLSSSAGRGIAALPGKLLNIGKTASAGCGGLQKMVRSIRNIGVVSLGMRVASGMFGRLRSIISSYISENEALNASVNAMKMQLGDALAPAINFVMAAMQRLMPIVTSVSNAINSIFTALFGKVKATSKAIASSAEAAGAAADSLDVYGFDQITKVSDSSSDGGNSGSKEQSALVQKLTGWIQQLKAAFVSGDWAQFGAIIGDGINSAFNALDKLDIGGKFGNFANNVFTVLHSALTRINFFAIGATVGNALTSAFQKINWSTVGETIGAALTALPSMLVGFILNTDWALVASSLSESIRSMLQSGTEWIRSVDWLQIGQCIADFIANVDWAGIATDLFSCLGTALGACVAVLWGSIEDAVNSIRNFFTEKIEAAGGNVAEGLWNGVVEGLGNIGKWINEHIFKPFINGICSIFEIHSPSKVMTRLFKHIPEGIINGIKSVDIFGKIGSWFKKNLLDPVSNGLGTVKTAILNFFQGLWSNVKGWINKLIGGIESMVNGIIKGVNWMIDGLNKIAALGEYIGIDFSISKINTVTLPKLARGAVVDRPTTAVIGEAGKEVVMPLENNTGWITQLAKQINQQGGGTPTSLALAIYFRSRKLAEYVIQDINQITKENGVCPIYV